MGIQWAYGLCLGGSKRRTCLEVETLHGDEDLAQRVGAHHVRLPLQRQLPRHCHLHVLHRRLVSVALHTHVPACTLLSVPEAQSCPWMHISCGCMSAIKCTACMLLLSAPRRHSNEQMDSHAGRTRACCAGMLWAPSAGSTANRCVSVSGSSRSRSASMNEG